VLLRNLVLQGTCHENPAEGTLTYDSINMEELSHVVHRVQLLAGACVYYNRETLGQQSTRRVTMYINGDNDNDNKY